MLNRKLKKWIWSFLAVPAVGAVVLAIPPAVMAQEDVEEIKTKEIVVTGTKTEHALEDAPVKTIVITQKEIAETHAQTIQDVLRYVPGIKIGRDSSSWGDKGKIMLRGLDAKHTLVLVDGHRIYGGHQDAVDISSYPVQMIERIEIVKGPGASLYGSEAIGGVINIITKKPSKKPTVGAFVETGSRNTQRAGFEAGIKRDAFGAYLNYTYFHTDGVHAETDEYNQNQVQGTLTYDFSPRSLFNVKLLYGEQEIEYEEREQTRVGVNPSWEWRPDDVSSLKIWGSWFQYDHITKDRETDYTHDVYETEINYTRLLFDRHNLTVGGQFEKEERRDRGKGYDAEEETKSLFISDEIDLYPVILVAGVRMDSHDLWGEEYNPKLNVLYNVTDRIKLRAGAGRAFNAPSLSKMYAQWRMGPYMVQPNPGLKPETSIGYELGADFALTKRVDLGVTFFRNEVENLIISTYTKKGKPPWDLNWINVDEAVTQGVEVDFKADITDRFSLALGYTYWDTRDEKTNLELAQRPRHKADLEAAYRHRDLGLTFVLNGEYVGSRYFDAENTQELEEYTVWDISVSKDIGEHAQAFVRLENIFGQDDVEDEYDLDGIGVMVGMKTYF